MSIKVVALIRRHPDLDRDEFLYHWQKDHPRYVWRLPDLERYVQNPALDHRTPWSYDGMAEMWFPSVKAVARAFASPDADALRTHEEHFIGSLDWFITTETVVPTVDHPQTES